MTVRMEELIESLLDIVKESGSVILSCVISFAVTTEVVGGRRSRFTMALLSFSFEITDSKMEIGKSKSK